MTEAPWAVIFETDDGKMYEVYIPPGFAFSATQGGLLILNEQAAVTGVLSARPLKGEGDVPEDEDRQGRGDADVGQPDDGGQLEDPAEHAGGRDAGHPDPGGQVRTDAEPGDSGSDPGDRAGDPEQRCLGHTEWHGGGVVYCQPGAGCNWDEPERRPHPDDAPGVTV